MGSGCSDVDDVVGKEDVKREIRHLEEVVVFAELGGGDNGEEAAVRSWGDMGLIYLGKRVMPSLYEARQLRSADVTRDSCALFKFRDFGGQG